MIVSGGYNIYPHELENIIGEHPAVARVAVIGVPHPKWGEAVKALVVLKPGHRVSAQRLIAMVAARKGSYQKPRAIEFIDAIPETAVHKADKKALRLRYGRALGKGARALRAGVMRRRSGWNGTSS